MKMAAAQQPWQIKARRYCQTKDDVIYARLLSVLVYYPPPQPFLPLSSLPRC